MLQQLMEPMPWDFRKHMVVFAEEKKQILLLRSQLHPIMLSPMPLGQIALNRYTSMGNLFHKKALQYFERLHSNDVLLLNLI
jgi:hypothetical protein